MCTDLRKMFPIGYTENGKVKYLRCSYKVDHVEKDGKRWIKCYDTFHRPGNLCIDTFIESPCGQCMECRLSHSREWADRLMLEALDHEHVYFFTLTYDNEHLPLSPYGVGTLRKKDTQDFWKRFRKHYGYNKVRYFLCGEYGDTTFRPHYHAIVFGAFIDDLKHYSFSGEYELFNSETVNKIWKNGHVVIANASWDTCCYTSRYVTKKALGRTSEFYDNLALLPEFQLSSRNPGIARKYFDNHYKSIYATDEVIFSTPEGGRRRKPPKYFDKCLEVLDETWYLLIKEQRMNVAKCHREMLLFTTKLTIEEIMRRRANALEGRVKHGLKRVL